MLQAGLVELVLPEGVTLAPKPSAAPGLAPAKPTKVDIAKQRNLVNRLINRIKQL
jgi:hypothetical protein